MLSKSRINRLKVQGYMKYSDQEISTYAFGNRFAFVLCGSIVALGVALADIRVLAAMTIIALGGVLLPYHPFDYLYNAVVAKLLNKPQLPPRSVQLKFSCLVATVWLIGTIGLFYYGYTLAGYIVGSLLLMVAFIVSSTDFCIPSTIYNFIFNIKIDK